MLVRIKFPQVMLPDCRERVKCSQIGIVQYLRQVSNITQPRNRLLRTDQPLEQSENVI